MKSPDRMKFISESLKPVVETVDLSAMASGAPGLPKVFVWRKRELEIAAVLRTWKETGACTHGGSERYVRKHWYEVETGEGLKAKIYFERQARGARLKRWWLYCMEEGDQF